MAKKKKKKKRKHPGKSVSPQSNEKIYESGLSHFRAGEYEGAISAWSRMVKNSGPKLATQLAEACFRNAMSKLSSGNMKAVISELHAALKYDVQDQPIHLFHMGLAHHRMGKFAQAISYYTRAIQAAPKVERYQYHLGLAHMQNGEIEESIKLFENIKGTQGRIGEALAYISQLNGERSLATLKAIRDGSARKLLDGLAYLTQGKAKEAKGLIKAAAREDAENGAPDYYLGVAHIRTDAIPSAISAWENASKKGLDMGFMKDDMANVYHQLAYRYFDRGDLAKVIKIWEKLLEIQLEDDEVRRNLVHAYFLRANDYARTEQFTYAIRYWEKAWELDAENADIAHNLALAHEKQDQLMIAEDYWKAAVAGWKRQMSGNSGHKEVLKARMHTVHIHLADIALMTGNTGKAIAEYRQALRYSPEEVETMAALADLYMMQGSSDKAIQLLSRARRLSPTDTDVLQQLSATYMMKGNEARALECLKEILKIDPGNELYQDLVSQYYLGSAEDALDMNKYKAALRFLNEGLEACPHNIELQAFAGAVYLNMMDKPQAEAVFQKIIDVNPTETKRYVAAAHHYLDSGMMDDAEAYFAKVVELDPDNPQTYIGIAGVYCSSHICEGALKYFEIAKKIRPGDAAILALIVETLMERDCQKHGVRYAEELMGMAPDDPRSYLHLGMAYHLEELDDEAMDTLIEGLEIAEKTDNKEMCAEIEELYNRIEFTDSPFGGLFDADLADLMDRVLNMGGFPWEDE